MSRGAEEYDEITGGDLNCIINARLDQYGGDTEFRNSAGCILQGICTKYDLLDVWRNRHKDKRCYTWTGRHSTNGSIIRTRIDKFLSNNSLNQFVTDMERTDQLHGFQWYNDYIPEKILGLFFGNVDCTRLNREAKIKRINSIITAWRYRDLSFKGKALVIHGLLTSTLFYNATTLAMPAWAISQIEELIYDFFWNYKRHLVNKDILALPLKEGGFNIPV